MTDPTADNLLKGATDHPTALFHAKLAVEMDGACYNMTHLVEVARHYIAQDAELADLRLIAEASEAWLKAHEWNIGHDRQVHQVDRLRAVGHADNAAREAFKMALTTWRTRTEKT